MSPKCIFCHSFLKSFHDYPDPAFKCCSCITSPHRFKYINNEIFQLIYENEIYIRFPTSIMIDPLILITPNSTSIINTNKKSITLQSIVSFDGITGQQYKDRLLNIFNKLIAFI